MHLELTKTIVDIVDVESLMLTTMNPKLKKLHEGFIEIDMIKRDSWKASKPGEVWDLQNSISMHDLQWELNDELYPNVGKAQVFPKGWIGNRSYLAIVVG